MSDYPAQIVDVCFLVALLVVVMAQLIGALKVYRLYGEIQRSVPANFARQLDEVQTDVALLVRGMDPRLLIQLGLEGKRNAGEIKAQQETLNSHTRVLDEHARTLDSHAERLRVGGL